MKRKIVCLILILAFAVACLSGCIFEIDEERDMNQVVATVTYKGNTAIVKKIDVVELYAQQGSSWQQYYGWNKEVFNYLLESLTNRKLLVLDAVDRGLCEWDNTTKSIVIYEKVDGAIVGPANGLTYADINEAQDKVNEQYKTVYETLLEEVKEEYAKGESESGTSGSEDDDEDEEKDIRPVRPLPIVEEDEEEKVYTEDAFDVESWFMNFTYSNNEERIAINRVKTMLENQYRSTVDDYQALQAQIEYVVIQKLQESLYGNEDLLVSDNDVWAKYLANLEANKEAMAKDEGAYTTAISNNQVFFYHPEDGYGTVKHVLLAFEEADVKDRTSDKNHIRFNEGWSFSEYQDRQKGDYSESALDAYRKALAQNLTVDYYGDFMAWFNDETNGYKSLDDDAKDALIDWRDGKTAINANLNYADFFKLLVDQVNAKSTIGDKLEMFENLIFGYSNPKDSGMFNNNADYSVKGEDESSYVEEFTAICQKLMMNKDLPAGFDGGVYGVDADMGKVGAMGWCVTDYGIHLVIVTNLYKNDNVDGATGEYIATSAQDLKNIILDNNDPDTTLYSYIKDSLLNNKKTNIINNYEINFILSVKEDAIKVEQTVIDRTFA